MIQRVYRQVRESSLSGMLGSVTVAAGEIQLEQIRIQLGPNVDIVTEPARRDTFLAIALAVSYLTDVKGADKDETVVVMPVDSFVDVAYFDKLGLIESALSGTDTDMVLVGAKPTRPSEKYGYIVPGNTTPQSHGTPAPDHDGNPASDHSAESASNHGAETAPNHGTPAFNYDASPAPEHGYSVPAHGANPTPECGYPVSRFKEKPTTLEAEKLIGEGALWNCGVFGFRLGYLLDIIEDNLNIRENRYETIRRQFTNLKRRSFDYEVVEHANGIRVIPYDGSWKDLGTWETFTEEIGALTLGNVYVDEQSTNTHVLNELDTPVVVMNTPDSVIAANREGILVSSKGESYRLKEAVDNLSGRPMQEEKRWGEYAVLDQSEHGGVKSLTKRLTINPGSQISYQSHERRKEIWTIIEGTGLLYLNDEKRAVGVGDTVTIREGEKHAIRAETRLEIIEVQIGDVLTESDIIRYEMVW
jgi:mannose-1-phosphate guanylyltransferase